MDFSLTEDQDAIRALAERLFADHLPDDARAKLYQEGAPFDQPTWDALIAAGLTGLVVPEGAGGSALGLMELAQVLEAQGAVCSPVPLLPTSLAALGLSCFAPDHPALAEIAAGAVVTVALPSYRFAHAALPTLTEGVLTGRADAVPYGMMATGALVIAKDHDQPVLLYVSLEGKGVTRSPATLMSGEQAAQLTFDNCDYDILASGPEALSFLQERAYTLQAALTVGVLQEALKRTADYIGDRKQFGRPIAGFQAVSQQMADAYMAIEALRTIMWKSLARLDGPGGSAPAAAGAVKYWVSEAAHKVAHTCLHLHGGIGQDLDYPIQRYFVWAKHQGVYLGSGTDHLPAIGALALDGALLKDYQALAPA